LAATKSRIDSRQLLTIVSVMVLVGTEVFGVALAGGWALAGLFELGTTLGYGLMGLFSALGLYAMVVLWRRSIAVERVRERI
jgi:hypothetical protein